MRVYADNAATTKMSGKAVDEIVRCMEEVYGNPSSLYEEGQKAAAVLNRSRELIAGCLGCTSKEITFTSGGSEADNQALLSAAKVGDMQNRRHIISAAFEHHAVLHTLDALKQQGFEITLLDTGADGIIRPEQVEKALRSDTCLVTIMYANNEIGTIQPVSEIGAVCRARGVLFHTDAVQAAGHLPIDVKVQNIDMLSISAHKFHGPKGAGALYARKDISLENVMHGGAQERGKRPGTENVPAIAAMAAALDEACKAMEECSDRLRKMQDRLISGLYEIPGAVLNGDRKRRLPGNVNFSFEGVSGEMMLLMLDQRGISASAGSACTAGSLDPSHVLLSIGRDPELAGGALRLSLSGYNTEQEVDYLISNIKEVVNKLRK